MAGRLVLPEGGRTRRNREEMGESTDEHVEARSMDFWAKVSRIRLPQLTADRSGARTAVFVPGAVVVYRCVGVPPV
jgi:hypothetical protein